MSAPLIASQQLQANLAGQTGTRERTSGSAATPTDARQALLHGESGTLGFLFDSPFEAAATPLDAKVPRGPHGGAGHPAANGQVLTALSPVALAPLPQPNQYTATEQPSAAAPAGSFITNLAARIRGTRA